MSLLSTKNIEATLYVGELEPQVTDNILYELFLQGSRVLRVSIPRDQLTSQNKGFGFVELPTPADADYCISLFNGVKLFGSPIKVRRAASDFSESEVGAKLFVGKLAKEIDESQLHHAFSSFGTFTEPVRIQRHSATQESLGFGFVSFSSFEESDAALAAMNGQWLGGKQIKVEYAFRENGLRGDRHGSDAERLIARRRREMEAAAMEADAEL